MHGHQRGLLEVVGEVLTTEVRSRMLRRLCWSEHEIAELEDMLKRAEWRRPGRGLLEKLSRRSCGATSARRRILNHLRTMHAAHIATSSLTDAEEAKKKTTRAKRDQQSK